MPLRPFAPLAPPAFQAWFARLGWTHAQLHPWITPYSPAALRAWLHGAQDPPPWLGPLLLYLQQPDPPPLLQATLQALRLTPAELEALADLARGPGLDAVDLQRLPAVLDELWMLYAGASRAPALDFVALRERIAAAGPVTWGLLWWALLLYLRRPEPGEAAWLGLLPVPHLAGLLAGGDAAAPPRREGGTPNTTGGED